MLIISSSLQSTFIAFFKECWSKINFFLSSVNSHNSMRWKSLCYSDLLHQRCELACDDSDFTKAASDNKYDDNSDVDAGLWHWWWIMIHYCHISVQSDNYELPAISSWILEIILNIMKWSILTGMLSKLMSLCQSLETVTFSTNKAISDHKLKNMNFWLKFVFWILIELITLWCYDSKLVKQTLVCGWKLKNIC